MILEPLEKRLAPAGFVSVILTGGVLKVTGDAGENGVSIEEISPDTFRVTGIDTMINFNGGTGSTFDIVGVTKGLTIDLKEGGDTLALNAMSVAGNVSVALGGGNNTMTLDDVDITGDFSVTALKDTDSITATDSHLSVSGKTTINLGDGDNSISLSQMSTLTLGKGLFYTGGKGLDLVTLQGSALMIGSAADFKVGAGGGDVEVIFQTANIQGGVAFTSLDHLTHTSEFYLNATSLNIAGSVAIKQGNGVSRSVLISDEFISVGGSVSVTHGNGSPDLGGLTQVASGGTLAVAGNITLVHGSGNHTVYVQGTDELLVGGKISVSNGNGNSNGPTTTQIQGGLVEVGDSISITNKAGQFDNSVSGGNVHVTNAINIVNGTANGFIVTTSSVIGAYALHAGAINITNGVGGFANTIAMSPQGPVGNPFFDTGTITHGITIKNGNTPALPGPAGASTLSDSGPGPLAFPSGTNNYIIGDFKVGGNIAITNGNGTFENRIGDDDETNHFSVGGGIAITNGNASIFGIENHFSAVALSVNKGITIKNGGGTTGGFVNEFEVGELNVIGALSLTNGNVLNGNLTNEFDSGSGHLGSLIIKNGNAVAITNEIDFQDELDVAGAVSITNGNILVPVLSGANPTGIINTIDGEPLVSLGSLMIKNGTGNAINEITGENLTIKGAASISSGAHTAGVSTYVLGADTVLHIGGPVSFLSTGGNTANIIRGALVELGSGLTISHAGGADTVAVGSSGGALFINGNVTAKLGEGTTTVEIGRNVSELSVFGSISVSALEGNDTLKVVGDGRVTGGISGLFGGGSTNVVDIGGSAEHSNAGLHVGGVINLVSSANAALEANFEDGSFGALKLSGGNEGDLISILGAHFRGAVNLDLKGSGDEVTIDDSLFSSSLTILTGEGQDTVDIEGAFAAAGTSRFLGAVSIDLGADNDELLFTQAGGTSAISFYSTVVLNGGAGTNTFDDDGDVNYFGSPAVISNFGV